MKGEIRLLGCILAQPPEQFYKFYPRTKTKRDGALDYWNRLLGEAQAERKEEEK